MEMLPDRFRLWPLDDALQFFDTRLANLGERSEMRQQLLCGFQADSFDLTEFRSQRPASAPFTAGAGGAPPPRPLSGLRRRSSPRPSSPPSDRSEGSAVGPVTTGYLRASASAASNCASSSSGIEYVCLSSGNVPARTSPAYAATASPITVETSA